LAIGPTPPPQALGADLEATGSWLRRFWGKEFEFKGCSNAGGSHVETYFVTKYRFGINFGTTPLEIERQGLCPD
jgi:hypothetical protein